VAKGDFSVRLSAVALWPKSGLRDAPLSVARRVVVHYICFVSGTPDFGRSVNFRIVAIS